MQFPRFLRTPPSRSQGLLRATLAVAVIAAAFSVGTRTARAAEFGPPDSLAPISHPLEPGQAFSLAAQGIFGSDDRAAVPSTTANPYSMVVFLLTEWSDGSLSSCSGFMIGARTVGTAGHCVYDAGGRGWARRVLAAPGANGGVNPYGVYWATSASTVNGWAQRRERASDIAAVTLATDVGHTTGAFAMRADEDATLRAGPVLIAGYPGDKSTATMWSTSGALDGVDAGLLYFRLDVTHGNSGGPVWRTSEAGPTVVGIVEGGDSSINWAVRTSQGVVDRFLAWAAGAEADGPTVAPAGAAPSAAAAPRTLVSSPPALTAPSGVVAYGVITVGATEGAGDLTVTSSGGALVADGLLSVNSCAGGTRACTGVTGNRSTRVVVPDAANDVRAVTLTLAGTVVRDTTVTVTASQGATTWQVLIPVTVQPAAGAASSPAAATSAGSGAITAGSVPSAGGFGLIVFGGGTGAQLLAASGCPASTAAFWASEGGSFVVWIPGAAVAAANAAWDAKFGGGIPAGTPLIARCR